ncbi:hypothetical protein N9891_01420, partial [bacterium]|nr:hypothetical protein [bacterium]
SPVVAIGETWYVEFTVTHENSPTTGDRTIDNLVNDQAGITFYSGVAGNNPGSENPAGTNQSIFVGINDWNDWAHRVQGLADNNPNDSAEASLDDDTFEYRVEITEGGTSDIYNFFYREDPADEWTQFGPTDLEQDFDNTVVGLTTKSNNANTMSSTVFDRLTIGMVPSVAIGPLLLSISADAGNLSFSWNGISGQQYDLLSSTDLSIDPSTWEPYNDGTTTHENIVASETGTIFLTDLPSVGQKRFFVLREESVEGDPEEVN